MMSEKEQILCVAALKQTLQLGINVCGFVLRDGNDNFGIAWNVGFYGHEEEMELKLRDSLPFSVTEGPFKTELPQ